MKRRTRPLERAEFRNLNVRTHLDVVIVHDMDDYALRWPETPLTAIFKRASSSATTSKASVVPTPQLGAMVPLVGGPIKFDHAPAAASAPGGGGSHAASLNFSLSPPMASKLSASSRRVAVNCIVNLERAAHDQQKTNSTTLQKLLPLSAAVQRPINCPAEVFELWVSERMKTATTDRPWGVPLISAFFTASSADEYFISTQEYFDERGGRRAGAASGSGGGSLGGISSTNRDWHLPFARVPVPVIKRQRATGGGRPWVEAADANNRLLASLPPMGALTLREVSWAVNDLDDFIVDYRRWRSEHQI